MQIKTSLVLLAAIATATTMLYFKPPSTHNPESAIKKPILRIPKNLQSKRHASETTVLNTYKKYEPLLAYNGFTLYPEGGTETVHLINMSGQTIHQWQIDVARAVLMPDCSLLTVHGSKWGLNRSPWKELRNTLRQYAWDGSVVWEFTGNDQPFHHDILQISNGNILAVRSVDVQDVAIIPQQLRNHPDSYLRSDEIIEISPRGKIVWRWQAHQHLDTNSCGKYACPPITRQIKSGKKPFDWIHINSIKPLPENLWHEEGDSRFKPGNILVMARNWSTAFIIEKSTGRIVWTYTGTYRGGLQYGHEAIMIDKNLPGAGNILLFDNGVERQQSIILEINPKTQKPVWIYDAGDGFFTAAAGAAQRLPNGNTLIAEDISGRVFEVTVDKKIVWAYTGKKLRSARPTRYSPDSCAELNTISWQ